ncbi:MAG: hypothetical protein GY931_19645 [Maribacter sp.]|nr:hypothetical protein [Maribacter sp.]
MNQIIICKNCGKELPKIILQDIGWKAIIDKLSNDSVTMAIAEIKYYAQCEESDAKKYIQHLLNCVYAWPMSPSEQELLNFIDSEFQNVQKPNHFTNYTHCDECETHDNTLKNKTKNTLTRKDLGNPGWDPIGFSKPQGLGYYFPVMVRYALLPDVWPDREWYGDQILSHLSYEGVKNKFSNWCSKSQQKAVYEFLYHQKIHAFNEYEPKELTKALNIWKTI